MVDSHREQKPYKISPEDFVRPEDEDAISVY